MEVPRITDIFAPPDIPSKEGGAELQSGMATKTMELATREAIYTADIPRIDYQDHQRNYRTVHGTRSNMTETTETGKES
jgi:hypothetical protein